MKISVVIPTTSRSASLEAAINSVLTQEGDFDIDVIVVYNNLKTDSELSTPLNAIVHCSKNQDIREFNLDNHTCANANTARNHGTGNATGDYVAYLDSDDLWYKDHLSSRLKLIEEKGATAAFGPFYINRGNRKKQRAFVGFTENMDPFEFIWQKGGLAQTSGFLVRTIDAIESPWDENLKRSQDHDFFVRMSARCNWHQVQTETYEVVWPSFQHRSYDFESYWTFYVDHKSRFSDPAACSYLFSRLLESAFSKGTYFKQFRTEITQRGNHLSFVKRLISKNRLTAVTGWYVNQIFN